MLGCDFQSVDHVNTVYQKYPKKTGLPEIISVDTIDDKLHFIFFSRHQEDTTRIVTILPGNKLEMPDTLNLMVFLPVESGMNSAWGNPFSEEIIHSAGYQQLFIPFYVSFSKMPWFVDHPFLEKRAQQQYFIKDVLPLLKKIINNIPHKIYLLGFSKGGWGALHLLLNYPELFEGAVAWDAPFLTGFDDKWGLKEIFDNPGYFNKFDLKVQVPAKKHNLENKKLVISGYEFFGEDLQQFHLLFDSLQVKHVYDSSLKYKHNWESGWLEPSIELLIKTLK
jgi:esterase/lipase superfamily enzyme